MQVKEYKTPEEALKEVKDPIIRSAIEPLSDKVAELEEITENLKKDNSLYVINTAEDAIKLIDIYIDYGKNLVKLTLGYEGMIPPSVIPEFDYKKDVLERLNFRVDVMTRLYTCNSQYRYLSDLYDLIIRAKNEVEDAIEDSKIYEGKGKRVFELPAFKLLEKLMIIKDIAEHCRAEENEGKQD